MQYRVLISINQHKLVQLWVELELLVQQSIDVNGEHGCTRLRCRRGLTAVDTNTPLTPLLLTGDMTWAGGVNSPWGLGRFWGFSWSFRGVRVSLSLGFAPGRHNHRVRFLTIATWRPHGGVWWPCIIISLSAWCLVSRTLVWVLLLFFLRRWLGGVRPCDVGILLFFCLCFLVAATTNRSLGGCVCSCTVPRLSLLVNHLRVSCLLSSSFMEIHALRSHWCRNRWTLQTVQRRTFGISFNPWAAPFSSPSSLSLFDVLLSPPVDTGGALVLEHTLVRFEVGLESDLTVISCTVLPDFFCGIFSAWHRLFSPVAQRRSGCFLLPPPSLLCPRCLSPNSQNHIKSSKRGKNETKDDRTSS